MVDAEVPQVNTLTPATFDKGAVRSWIDQMHGTSPGLLHICSTGNWAGRTFEYEEYEKAADYVELLDDEGREGIYLRTTTLSRKLDDDERGGVEDSYMLPGFAGDIDIMGPGHKHNPAKTGGRTLPPDISAAVQIVRRSGLPEPTTWVHSGGGIYPWWLLEKGWDIRESGQREMAEKLSVGIQQVLYRSALRLGWHYGAEVSDMARVLRIPGTVNRKVGGAQLCQVMQPSEYEFVHAASLAREVELALKHLPAPEAPRPKIIPKIITASENISPGDDYENKIGWADILTPAGWTYVRHRGATMYWRRPGKDQGEHSASTGNDPLRDRLYVFSSSTEFTPNEPYTKFAAYAILHHNGNFGNAARDLRNQGFGGQRPAQTYSTDLHTLAGPAAVKTPAPVEVAVDAPVTEAGADEKVGTFTRRTEAGKPMIELGSGPEAIRNLTAALNARLFADIYVANGKLLHVTPASGSAPSRGKAKAKADDLDLEASIITAEGLAAILSSCAHVHQLKAVGAGENKKLIEKEATPPTTVLKAVLAQTWWPGVPVLRGIIGAPVLRPDGSLVQKPGYDEETGLYYKPMVKIPAIPDRPTKTQIEDAKRFVFSEVFGEFCWSSTADFANYLALLVSPILRPYINTLTPFGIVTAPTRGSGKTNLTDAVGMLYGQAVQVYPKHDEEFRKSITTTLMTDVSPVVIFDNLAEGATIRSSVLAKLMTGEVWSDRILGGNKQATLINDRLWLATGNGLTVGGDMASRTVLVRLDPRMAKPELRTFEMGQFSDWIRVEANRTKLLVALLTLVRGWIDADAPTAEQYTMRGFTRWAQAMGGFLEFLGIFGFLGNVDELEERDADQEEWATFLAKWHQVYADKKRSARVIHASSRPEFAGGMINMDPWAGSFLLDDAGNTPNPKKLGEMLSGHRDKFYDKYVLRGARNTSTNSTEWWVEKIADEENTA